MGRNLSPRELSRSQPLVFSPNRSLRGLPKRNEERQQYSHCTRDVRAFQSQEALEGSLMLDFQDFGKLSTEFSLFRTRDTTNIIHPFH